MIKKKIMDFKGTKGKWELMNSEALGIPYIVYVNHETIFQCYNSKQENDAKANALLISKAPEMLKMLKELRNAILSEDYTRMLANSQLAKELIKEATEL